MPVFLISLALLLAAQTSPKGPFDGDWVADLRAQDASRIVDDYLVADGQYACKSCEPPRSYPSDGRLHTIVGDPDIASESVTVLSPRSILTRELSPVRVREVTMTVAPDGKTATYVAIDRRKDISGDLRTEYVAERIGAAPPGANHVSGRWRGVRYVMVPAAYRLRQLRQEGEKFTVDTPRGGAYSAILGGPFSPVGTEGRFSVAFRFTDRSTITEIFRDGDKVIRTRTYTLSPDGRALEIATTEAATGAVFKSTSRRQ